MAEAECALKCGLQVTLLGRAIVSAFIQVTKEVVHNILTNNDTQDRAECSQKFLHTSTFCIQWDSMIRGTGSMTNGTSQECTPSQILWLIYIATTLEWIDPRILESQRVRPPLRNPNSGATTNRVLLHSYGDDIDPVLITSRISNYDQETKRLVIEIMYDAAVKGELHWHIQKDRQLHLYSHKLYSIKTLGLVINKRFKFNKHIKSRTQKATMAYQTMARL